MKFIKNSTIFLILLFSLILTQSCTEKNEIKSISTYKVIKKDLLVTINDTGEIGSENESTVLAAFSSKIDTLIDEGKIVKKNTLVGKLSTSKEEKERDKIFLTNQESEYDRKIAVLAKYKDTYRISKELENAQIDIKIAKLKLKSKVEVRDSLAIVKAEEELNTLNKEMSIYQKEIPDREKLYKSGYMSINDLMKSKNKLTELIKQKKYLLVNLKVLKKGPLNEEIEKEKVNLKTAEQSLSKKKQEMESFIKTSNLEIDSSQAKIKKTKEKFDYYSNLIKRGSLITTDDGIVVYGKMLVGDEQVKVKAGDSVREGVSIIKIFDLKKPILKMFINEVDISKIHLEQKVKFSLDAYPENLYNGQIIKIAPVADKKFERDKNNIVVFEVIIKIIDNSPLLKPGMTANIEITTDNIRDVISVPSQVIFKENNKTYCYLKNGEKTNKQYVTTGISNEMETVIKNGLKIGDEVVTEFQEKNN
ncbi:MAG: HlyD family efflux transporter periplasmic adaptor subunit [Candidatus Sericytochromatia bacterium]|nr:HlyD family efflux transporter periplasmic adaptor subunit [Candidatus Sericytochromatia bacterium]